MTTIRSIGGLLLVSVLLAGCSTGLGKTGSTPAFTELPAALLSGPIGKELSEGDRKAAADAEFKALEFGRAGTPVPWKNRLSGNSGEVTPGASYRVNAVDCRDVTHTLVLDDAPPLSIRATSCRQPEGIWRPVT